MTGGIGPACKPHNWGVCLFMDCSTPLYAGNDLRTCTIARKAKLLSAFCRSPSGDTWYSAIAHTPGLNGH